MQLASEVALSAAAAAAAKGHGGHVQVRCIHIECMAGLQSLKAKGNIVAGYAAEVISFTIVSVNECIGWCCTV